MRWGKRKDGGSRYAEAKTPVGSWLVEPIHDGYAAWWYPKWGYDEVYIGTYKTERAAKNGCVRYARRLAAQFAKLGAEE